MRPPSASWGLEWLGNFLRRAGDNNGIERFGFGPSQIAVADFDSDRFVALGLQVRFCLIRKWTNNFDGEHHRPHLCQDGRLVAGSGADFKDPLTGLNGQHLGHQRHDIGLGYGLPVTNGQWRVRIGHCAQRFRHKSVPGNGLHGAQHAGVLDSPGAQLLLDHLLVLPDHIRFLGLYRSQGRQ